MKTQASDSELEILNCALSEELFAIDQYLYFYFMCQKGGNDALAAVFKAMAVDEMGHVGRIGARIAELGAKPMMKRYKDISQPDGFVEMLKLATSMEDETVRHYNEWAASISADSSKILKEITPTEQKHRKTLADEASKL